MEWHRAADQDGLHRDIIDNLINLAAALLELAVLWLWWEINHMAALIGISVKPKSGYTCKVPLDLLSEDGTPPAEGDSVSYSVDGTVQSVDAEDATVKITAVNGQPVDESASDEASEDQGPPQPGGQTPVAASGPISPATAALGAALRKKAKGQPMPF